MKTEQKAKITAKDPKIQQMVDEIDFSKEGVTCFHAYPEPEEWASPNNEFDEYLVNYNRFMAVAKIALLASFIGLLAYLYFR